LRHHFSTLASIYYWEHNPKMNDDTDAKGSAKLKIRCSVHRVATPPWMHRPARVNKFLAKVFPKRETDARQARGARQWSEIIMKFFVAQESARVIADEWECKTSRISRIVQRIRLAAAGRRQDGSSPTGRAKGRPPSPAMLEKRKLANQNRNQNQTKRRNATMQQALPIGHDEIEFEKQGEDIEYTED
jgi:hypothetical protein